MKLWRNLKVSKKIGTGIGSVVVILGIVSLLAYSGIGNIVADADQVIQGNKLDALLAQKEVDHLNWVNQVNALITDDTVSTLEAETDHRQCSFGKWLYGNGRKEAEQLVPELAPHLKALEAPHEKLHRSAAKIKTSFRPADPSLLGQLQQREIDHLHWAASIRDSLLNQEPVTVQTDPLQCALGRWIDSDQAGSVYARGDQEFKTAWDAMVSNHETLHKSALTVKAALAASPKAAEAKFRSETLPALARTLDSLKVLKQEAEHEMAGLKAATAIYASATVPALAETQARLEEARAVARKHILTDQQMLDRADHTRFEVMVFSIGALIAGLLLSVLIARSISRPIARGVDFAKMVSQGDLSRRLDIDQTDEIGELSDALNAMTVNLKQMFMDIATGTQTLTASSTELSAISDQIASNSRQTAATSTNVSAAAEQMSTSMTSVAAATEQTTTNIQMIVTAAEEMAATTQEITSNVTQAASGLNEVNENINQTSVAAGEVTQDITRASTATDEMSQGSTQVMSSAGELSVLAESLNEMVGRFRLN